MKVGFFSTGGYTEAGGLQVFLDKIRPDAEWVRLCPAVQKPAGKRSATPLPGRRRGTFAEPFPTPVPDQGGLTGDGLVHHMLTRLARYSRDCDAYVLIDDADCRFCDDTAGFETWAADVRLSVCRAVGREVPFAALLAVQEVESWLYADWNLTFKVRYPHFAHELRRSLEARGWGRDGIEAFGCPASGGACTTKPSELLSALVVGDPPHVDGRRYSKKVDAPPMLREARPDQVADRCRTFFRPAYHEIQRWPSPSVRGGGRG